MVRLHLLTKMVIEMAALCRQDMGVGWDDLANLAIFGCKMKNHIFIAVKSEAAYSCTPCFDFYVIFEPRNLEQFRSKDYESIICVLACHEIGILFPRD